jgi:hypothetical protein
MLDGKIIIRTSAVAVAIARNYCFSRKNKLPFVGVMVQKFVTKLLVMV